MKLAIVGSRTWTNWQEILRKIHLLKPEHIISGGAYGVDSIATDIADCLEIPFEEILPNWDLGRSAGAIRNQIIVYNCDKLIAFWDGKSKGTKISIDMAKRANKLLEVVYER